MRARGDLAGLAPVAADAADEGATATESVAACICRGLRRQFAIEITAFARAPDALPPHPVSCCIAGPSRRRSGQNGRPSDAGPSLPPNRPFPDQIRDSRCRIRLRLQQVQGNHENLNKSKGPGKCPGLW
jgi:hypothetical protein